MEARTTDTVPGHANIRNGGGPEGARDNVAAGSAATHQSRDFER
jgi:hypothetical protein